MREPTKAAILGAGSGTRIKELADIKPFVTLDDEPLICRLVRSLKWQGFESITLALNSGAKNIEFQRYPDLAEPSLNKIFVDTPSSMHTLFEAFSHTPLGHDEHLFVIMADTIMLDEDLAAYVHQCRTLPPGESSIVATTFIDDEKPLTLSTDAQGYVMSFNVPVISGTLATSGVYCLSSSVRPLLEECLAKGLKNMRVFLNMIVENNKKLKVFVVKKSIDVDRPSDLEAAKDFLHSKNKTLSAQTLMFDFGGTLDSDGIHSRTLFFDSFVSAGLWSSEERQRFQDAYSFADTKIVSEGLAVRLKLADMNMLLCKLIAGFLGLQNIKKIEHASALITQTNSDSLKEKYSLMKTLSQNFTLGVVSNFSGNLNLILEEFSLREFFSFALDSFDEGVSKPDLAFFHRALAKTHCSPQECVFIGDNIERDIKPAKKLGMKTILVSTKHQTFLEPDLVVASVRDLPRLLRPIQKK